MYLSESWLSVLVQVTPPYLCAGLGMVAAGLVLDSVQYWPVFQTLPELFIMVPALIGLKGNLEMTLASRYFALTYYSFIKFLNILNPGYQHMQTWGTWTPWSRQW